MQDMLVTLAATITDALMDTSKNRRQFVNIILANIARTYQVRARFGQFFFSTIDNEVIFSFFHFCQKNWKNEQIN